MYFGRRMGVVIGYFEFEFVSGIFPVAGIGGYGDFEDGEIVGVGEVYVGNLTSVEFGNVCESEEIVLDNIFFRGLRLIWA